MRRCTRWGRCETAFGLWHQSATAGSSLFVKQSEHPSVQFDVLFLSKTTVLYGCPLLDNIKEVRLVLDTGKGIIKMSYAFGNTSKFFWFDLEGNCYTYKEVELELVNHDNIVVSKEVLFRNTMFD